MLNLNTNKYIEYFDNLKDTQKYVFTNVNSSKSKSQPGVYVHHLTIEELESNFPEFGEEIMNAFRNYKSNYNFLPHDGFIDSVKIKKYHKSVGRLKEHVDCNHKSLSHRFLAFIIYLNDIEKGGETEFSEQKVKIKPKRNKISFFPPFWTHPHLGNTPESNDKYIINGFMSYKF